MIYIKRKNNQIIDINLEETEGFEKANIYDQDVKNFLKDSDNESVKNTIMKLDLSMARISEDMINTLIEKKIILFTDFPEVVQNKLNFKRMLREQLNTTEELYDDEELKL